jgi:hypothetical protein
MLSIDADHGKDGIRAKFWLALANLREKSDCDRGVSARL